MENPTYALPDSDGGKVKYVVGESVSWTIGSDKDGNAIAIYEEDEETVKKFYENWKKSGEFD